VSPTGLELAREYHREVVGPLLLSRWPQLRYAAARLGSGSDVLGLDDPMSQDHDWGLRLNVLVPAELVSVIDDFLEEALPATFGGRPTRFATTWQNDVRSGVQVDSTRDLAVSRLGLDPARGLDVAGWLGLTGQSVLEVTAGEVFHDSAGDLTDVRHRLRWYPDDIWRYVLAADWSRLAEELPLAGRAGQRGDDAGSRVIMGRLVRTAMHLGFLLGRQWPPYAKWLGTAYAALPVGVATGPALASALESRSWPDREARLVDGLNELLEAQRALRLPTPRRATEPFWDRPFRTVSDRVAELLLDGVTDPAVRALPPAVGSVEQWVDSVAVLGPADRRLAVARAVLAGGQLRSTDA
jgi:hypothetical protein